MENYLNPYDKEYMRLAILKHEETFKHQVHELHRLYRIQKLLMRSIAKERPNPSQEKTTQHNNINFADKKPDLETRPSDHEDHHAAEDEIEIELTLGPSTDSMRRKNRIKNATDTTPLTSTDHSGATFSSSSTGSSHNRTSCLSTHNNGRLNTKSEDNDELGLFQVPNLSLDYQNQSNDQTLRQERLKQPPWLFQVLSLNMTTN